jgi:hypothetical protein
MGNLDWLPEMKVHIEGLVDKQINNLKPGSPPAPCL